MEWFKRRGITKPILSRKAGNTYTLLSERKRFRSSLDYEKSRSDIVTVSENDNWFISLGQSVSELKTERAARIIMGHRNYKFIVVHMDIIYDPEKNVMFIGDVVSEIENKGYGSRVLEFTIKLAESLDCKTIRGNLGVADVDHFDKLKYWYEKYGFIVDIKDNSGKILLNL